jgi:hypothetical protein
MDYLRATSDGRRRNGEKWPQPSGLRRKSGPYFVVILDCGPTTAFGFRLV